MSDLDILLHEAIIANFNIIIFIVGTIFLPILIFATVKIFNAGYRELIEFKNNQPEIVQQFLEQAIEIAYRFVEQKTKELNLDNTDKLKLAVTKANNILKGYGFDLPEDLITTALESFIHKIHDDGVTNLDVVKDMKNK